ncbi:MAG: lipoyl synthase, partial [Acidimicrobiales bacterium]|nr:lipoyl synthase [Acidimicrobiales bacterium]
MAGPLRVRWLGRVPYREALALQQALFTHGAGDHLLLLEHPHVFTHGPRADLATNLRVEPASVGAELVGVKRGGDVTYHGPGQLVGYPIVGVPNSLGAGDHVCAIQRLVVGVLQDLGVADVGCLDDYPGVWVGVSGPNPRKICAIGVRLAHGRT